MDIPSVCSVVAMDPIGVVKPIFIFPAVYSDTRVTLPSEAIYVVDLFVFRKVRLAVCPVSSIRQAYFIFFVKERDLCHFMYDHGHGLFPCIIKIEPIWRFRDLYCSSVRISNSNLTSFFSTWFSNNKNCSDLPLLLFRSRPILGIFQPLIFSTAVNSYPEY